ncbi:hypothetical protein B0H21DRAFT_522720 [Amylocystis lapponica]|nr:hypothetical protein B0H21DRAFT_522720 [Amylocystis lapponica]
MRRRRRRAGSGWGEVAMRTPSRRGSSGASSRARNEDLLSVRVCAAERGRCRRRLCLVATLAACRTLSWARGRGLPRDLRLRWLRWRRLKSTFSARSCRVSATMTGTSLMFLHLLSLADTSCPVHPVIRHGRKMHARLSEQMWRAPSMIYSLGTRRMRTTRCSTTIISARMGMRSVEAGPRRAKEMAVLVK